MSKVRNFSEIAPNIAFPEFNFYELYYSTFEKSELGRIKKLLPLREMADNFGLVRKSMRPKPGCRPFFTPEGKVALMFLKMHKRLFGVEAKKVGGDTGYAGTENRDYCKANGIQTSFVKRCRPFGEKKKKKDLVRKELARVRATAMEGSFGTQKEHYNLRRVKAMTKRTEILYIFFGIHTANVVQLADRIEQRARLAAADTEICSQCGALVGKLYPRHEKQTKNPAETTGNRYRTEILRRRTQKLKRLSAASLILKTLNDNP